MEQVSESEFKPNEWVEAQEAAAMLGRSRSAITRYVQQGKLTAIRKYGRLFVRRDQLENFKHPPRGNPKLRE